jgi:hypothetical protein
MCSAAGLAACRLNPGGCIVRRFAAKHQSFLAYVVSRAALTVSRRNFGKEKGTIMKFATVSKSLVLGLAVLLASSAFAATKGSLALSNPVLVNGTTLKAGDYKVQWEGTGSSVELSIIQGKNVVAKVPAHVIELPSPAANDAAVTRTNASGPNTLAGVRFAGKKTALDLTDGGMADGSSK